MAEQATKPLYEVVIWDYDAASDADSMYYVHSRTMCSDLRKAKSEAYYAVEDHSFVSAAVFLNGERLAVYGSVGFAYPKKGG